MFEDLLAVIFYSKNYFINANTMLWPFYGIKFNEF